MASVKLRDRDAIITKEGLIFRVFGYSHPSDAFVCDAEYAPTELFKSDNPRAFRGNGASVHYKFYEDEGWRFINRNYLRYTFLHEMLGKRVVGVKLGDVEQIRKPTEVCRDLMSGKPTDELLAAMQEVLELVAKHSGLSNKSFGVFGSLLHGFHHPRFSDIDLTVCGCKNVGKLLEFLEETYSEKSLPLKNEFATDAAISGKSWRFRNYSQGEFVKHERRKQIYAVFGDKSSGRVIKTEFEPVKDYEEIKNEYNSKTRILQMGWVTLLARIVEDGDAPFIPSVYRIEPLEVLEGAKDAVEAQKLVSYLEEFRMQAHRDETVYVEGNLEKVATPKQEFHQITLTYGPRYYDQVVKSLSLK